MSCRLESIEPDNPFAERQRMKNAQSIPRTWAWEYETAESGRETQSAYLGL